VITPKLSRDDGFLIVAIPIGPNQATDLATNHIFGKVRGHVASVLFSVNKQIDIDLFLLTDPKNRRLLFNPS
jgi:hypothetical protein